jgi:hypothetical protein
MLRFACIVLEVLDAVFLVGDDFIAFVFGVASAFRSIILKTRAPRPVRTLTMIKTSATKSNK